MRDLPRSGIEPESPALASGSLTSGPPGKPLENILFWESSVALPHLHLLCFTKPFNGVMSQVLHNVSCLWAPGNVCSQTSSAAWTSRLALWTRDAGSLALVPRTALQVCSSLASFALNSMTTFSPFIPLYRVSPGGNIRLHEERSLVCAVHGSISELDYIYIGVWEVGDRWTEEVERNK